MQASNGKTYKIKLISQKKSTKRDITQNKKVQKIILVEENT